MRALRALTLQASCSLASFLSGNPISLRSWDEFAQQTYVLRCCSSVSLGLIHFYDTENRLIKAKKASKVIADYSYDGDGGRTKKITYTYSSGGGGGGPRKIPSGDLGMNIIPFDLEDFVDYFVKGSDKLFGITEAQADVVTPMTTIFVGGLYEINPATNISIQDKVPVVLAH